MSIEPDSDISARFYVTTETNIFIYQAKSKDRSELNCDYIGSVPTEATSETTVLSMRNFLVQFNAGGQLTIFNVTESRTGPDMGTVSRASLTLDSLESEDTVPHISTLSSPHSF